MKFEVDIRRYVKTGTFFSVVAVLWLLAACSDDVPQQDGLEEVNLELRAVTRSGTETNYGDIRVFLTYPDVDEVYTGIFEYNSTTGNWRSKDLRVKPGTRIFYLYGYMPATELTGVATTSLMDENNYKLTIPNLSPLTTDDVCFVTGVVRSTKEEEIIQRGYYTFKYENSDYAEKTILNLLMEHLYGRIVFRFQIGDEYSQLRQIKVKKVSIEAVAQKLNAEIKLPEKATDEVSVKYTSLGGSENFNQEIWTLDPATTPEEDQFLKTAAGEATFGGVSVAVGSGLSESYVLVCEYEVYDKKGHKLSDRTARNSLNKVLPQMGEERTVTLTIEPTYLYQLGDDDLNNPEMTITN
jgi:hypothetical protein